MIKCVLYDLDGVLVDACEIHRVSLNRALKEISNTEISIEEHFNIQNPLNGLPTKKKLNVLLLQGRIKEQDIDLIFNLKQEYTIEEIKKHFNKDLIKIELHRHNRWNGLKSVCVTNSIVKTAALMLECTEQLDYMEFIISNEAVRFPKPHSEGYVKAMIKLGFYPEECIIVEDSPNGLLAAKGTGAHIWQVSGPEEVNYDNFQQFMFDLNKRK